MNKINNIKKKKKMNEMNGKGYGELFLVWIPQQQYVQFQALPLLPNLCTNNETLYQVEM